MGLRDQYGTQAMIGGTRTAAPAPVAPLAQSMQNTGANVYQGQTSYQGSMAPPGGYTPGQAMTPAPDAQTAQAQYQGALGGQLPAMQQQYQIGQPMTNLLVPSTLGTNPVPQPMIYPFGPGQPDPRNPQLPPSDTTTQTGNGGGLSTIPGANNGLPGQANTGSSPYGSGTGVPGPGAPVGPYTNQASQLNPNRAANVQGGARGFIDRFNANHPLMNLSVDAFNKANQQHSETAFQMATQGGQQFRNAIMEKNHWTQDQMNQWLNQVYSENQGGIADPNSGTAATFAKYGAQKAQPTAYGPQGYAPGFTGPTPAAGPVGFTDYTKSPTYTGGAPSSITPTVTTPPPKIPPVTVSKGNPPYNTTGNAADLNKTGIKGLHSYTFNPVRR